MVIIGKMNQLFGFFVSKFQNEFETLERSSSSFRGPFRLCRHPEIKFKQQIFIKTVLKSLTVLHLHQYGEKRV